MALADGDLPGRIILPLITLGGIALWMSYYGFLGKRPRSKVQFCSGAGRLIEKYSVPLYEEKEKALSEVHDAKEDHFSQLPDDVLSSILAHLTVTEAVRTSVLSKRWKYLFASMPTLEFRCLNMFGIGPSGHSRCPYYQQKLLKGVNQLLQLYLGRKVANVEMTFCLGREFSSEFDQWMHSISRLGVERLCLSFDCGTNHPIYDSNPIRDPNKLFKFSLELLSPASSLTYLLLKNCVVQPRTGVHLNSVRTLSLSGVLLERGQLEGIFSSCSNLNRLMLDYCRLPDKLQISGTVTSIVFFVCGGLEEIDLRAKNLRLFECIFFSKVRFYFSCVPMLENVMINFRGATAMPYIFGDFASDLPAQVKSLTVKADRSQINCFPTEIKMFRNLRELTLVLVFTYEFDIVKISPILGACPLLRYVHQARTERSVRESCIRPPLSPIYHTELKEVTFGGFYGTRAEIEFALYILRSAMVLEQMFLSPCFTCYSGSFTWEIEHHFLLAERERNSIEQELHGQAISRNAVVIIQ
ncbi:putative F-box/FBD/LRR-repeat protein At1g78840 isoform X2 [Lycium barbarum]|uniref:putative F-box/FBD/LRR-repeat protein At1g78840 isoform X2 n=1 Tax=Lycium barbarum TaxID=112863 RepID=UPI00293E467D|nr:putative F-box/FBD/LRR-repeat protein At1g78840 isoform X2 [Lycium barbarum]